MFEFENIQSEQCGIPNAAIQAFEEKLRYHQIRMHGYMMLSGKAILAEKYWNHTMRTKIIECIPLPKALQH